MPVSTRIKNQHLLWRSAFGPMAELTASLDSTATQNLWELIRSTSADAPQKIIVVNSGSEGMMGTTKPEVPGTMTVEEIENKKRMLRRQSRDELSNLNLIWLHEMVNSKAQLREKMAFFWHGHFACKVNSSFFSQELLHSIRTNALGNFGNLLREVSKSAAMLQFLNNQQNKKGRPNENFAREVMELFTMGIGNYSENDVKEAARAFTGWGYNAKAEFVFRAAQHDSGQKNFLGKTGNFNGDDIINILLEQPKTAEYITRKIYKYFVNETVDERIIKSLAGDFMKSNLDIGNLLDQIYTSDWFYDEKHIGTKIKSPVELIAGIRRFLPLQFDNENAQLLFQRVLGQILFYPPNVAGWPGGTTWIDSSTLMVRLQVPQVLAAKENITIKPKNDDDVNMGKKAEVSETINNKNSYSQKAAMASIDWTLLLKVFDKTARTELVKVISSHLLQTERVPASALQNYLDEQTRESFTKSAIINIMSTPEYQMC